MKLKQDEFVHTIPTIGLDTGRSFSVVLGTVLDDSL